MDKPLIPFRSRFRTAILCPLIGPNTSTQRCAGVGRKNG